jgi:hypothetical protein
MRQRLNRQSDRLVVAVDQLGHQRGDGIGIKRLAPFGDEDKTVIVCPRSAGCEAFFGLAAVMFPKRGHGLPVDADDSGPATFSSSFDPLPPHNGG